MIGKLQLPFGKWVKVSMQDMAPTGVFIGLNEAHLVKGVKIAQTNCML